MTPSANNMYCSNITFLQTYVVLILDSYLFVWLYCIFALKLFVLLLLIRKLVAYNSDDTQYGAFFSFRLL